MLAGGASRRMGTDKALIDIDGRTMACRVADALGSAGAMETVAIGGNAVALSALGLEVVADRWPGEGPLGGLATALCWAPERLVVVAACDQPWLDATTVQHLLEAHVAGGRRAPADRPMITVGSVDGAVQPLPGVYDRELAASICADMMAGRRALHGAMRAVTTQVVALPDGRPVRDVDRPSDLPGRYHRRGLTHE